MAVPQFQSLGHPRRPDPRNAHPRHPFGDEAGRAGQQLLYRSDEPRLALEAASHPWSFTADGGLFRLVSEAGRISLAHLFDPYLAVQTSTLTALPHQVDAVYNRMLPRHPLRFLLADDPGAGKTIMAGLFLKGLMIRGDVDRCLIIAPGSLVEQWSGSPASTTVTDVPSSARKAGSPAVGTYTSPVPSPAVKNRHDGSRSPAGRDRHPDGARAQTSGDPLRSAGLRADQQARVVPAKRVRADQDGVGAGALGVNAVEVLVVGQQPLLPDVVDVAVDRHGAAQEHVRTVAHARRLYGKTSARMNPSARERCYWKLLQFAVSPARVRTGRCC
jgi:hypothetical protein